jgi:hypothetical protein
MCKLFITYNIQKIEYISFQPVIINKNNWTVRGECRAPDGSEAISSKKIHQNFYILKPHYFFHSLEEGIIQTTSEF